MIVGIGASAGGLAALEAFFKGLPASPSPGPAFVIVQHLSPGHVSILAELLGRLTKLAVVEITDGLRVAPDTVHVLTPNHELELVAGAFRLLPRSESRGLRLPVDHFFCSLAQDQRERAVGIVLSGTGSDGTLGVRAINAEGGLVLVQAPSSTAFYGMPQSALATGLVDLALPPEELGAALLASLATGRPLLAAGLDAPSAETIRELTEVCRLLRTHTGHDFSGYKYGTIRRRIERRMAVHHVEAFDGYLALLERTPTELDALFDDLLIGVTQFFRDPDEFERLERDVLPASSRTTPRGRRSGRGAPAAPPGRRPTRSRSSCRSGSRRSASTSRCSSSRPI